MTDQVRGVGAVVARRRVMLGVDDSGPFPGRHASRTEIAAETPIFHSLTAGGWRSRQQEPAAERRARRSRRTREADPLSEFRRDPLTAPIPAQAYTASAPSVPRSGRHSSHSLPDELSERRAERRRQDGGRHSRYEAAMRAGVAMGW
ncbi:hypothetical protein PSU4_19620 [Pseudonocardia sulfidoxydans NBRC 16205]|uniref:Uncharacterized protein n=1 Tax=Pseudonocardia sulfidoxydans NBRC 16205 TaxID=1223511 RepID=A0A511DJ09_9PSEU|nr:hypothetical protein [Pseudonocardia sulfidoxydans]GEL23008.1 hypothetical protein PSU4_19620 [Pseudonocardia sulfidoxydans NBRC 16205]